MSGENNFEFIEPWFCGNCDEFMYNKDQDGYPAPGAPVGLAVKYDNRSMRICLLCAEMYISILNNPYMLEQHKEWLKEITIKNKLKPGHNYLDK
jgi:hypothetical protein